jgi:hypothetical protein
MPFEPTYGLPYEAPSDLPGWSLTGGPDGDMPILAERVAAQLRRLDDLMQALTDSFGFYPDIIQAGVEDSIALNTAVSTSFYNANYWRGQHTVVFDTPFTTVLPAVMVTAITSLPGTVIECSVSGVSLTGFTINIARQNQTATSVGWVASAQTQL